MREMTTKPRGVRVAKPPISKIVMGKKVEPSRGILGRAANLGAYLHPKKKK